MPSPKGARQTLSKIPAKIQEVMIGGGGGIRTHDPCKRIAVFKTAWDNRSLPLQKRFESFPMFWIISAYQTKIFFNVLYIF